METTLLRTTEKCTADLADLAWFIGGTDLAYVVLYQGAKAWQEAVRKRVTKSPSLAVEVAQTMTDLLAAEKRPKKAEWERAAAFAANMRSQLTG